MINKKKIFLMSSIAIAASASIIAVAAACTEEQKPEQKSNQNQSDSKSGSGSGVIRNNSSKNSIKFTVALESNTLNYRNQKHNITLNVGSQYARKIVEVELKPNSSSSSGSSIKSTKAPSNSRGEATVVFSGLEHNKSYYISAVNVYEDLRKTTPIVSNSYFANTNETLVVKTPANGDGSNNVGSSKGSFDPNQNNFNPGSGPLPNLDNLEQLQQHIARIQKEKEQREKYRPVSASVPDLKIKPEQAYEKIKNRSFAIGFNSVDYAKESNGQINNSVVPFEPTGTGWLLDYAWKKGEKTSDEVMLYIATNAHVYNRAFNAMDTAYKSQFPEYFTKEERKNAKVDSFVLAVPKKDANLNPIPSGKSYGPENKLQYFVNATNHERFSSERVFNDIEFLKEGEEAIFSNPRTVFVALNIFDEQRNKELYNAADNEEDRKYSAKDFAVFGIKVNYKKLKEKAGSDPKYKLLLDHIDAAMKSIDDDIKKFSEKKHPNHDQSTTPYLSLDYPSMWINKDRPLDQQLDKAKYNIDNNTSLNIERAYIAGFPKIGSSQMLWRNYPEGSSIPEDAFNGNSFGKGIGVSKILDDQRESTGFGFNGYVDFSSIYFGASGSLVVNEYGLPIGIYSVTDSKVGDKDISKRGGFTFLVQAHNDNKNQQTGPSRTLISLQAGPAHNLIDGSDQEKYPYQKKSYRQNLNWLSKQDNSEFKEFAKTAIFKKGA
ncbi:hypothetical protein JM47_03440 [Ureaplasma diversum]|uniref:DUF31 domain-containing protein n=1 Tax=Ureaplasma diversum TaxID=42094 RepID=A0A0C5RCD5_9BACT|nr:DUF31 family protein [Ureaplasma diversum]AJQ45581.1 hypothetical protein JM47_03440 [Ureaplasma diversum]